ncbi:MAG: glycosyltransferase [Methylobacterium mesophilicum]|nr:glycosyltransferase [Methylobacterium mesophilicum]
MTPAGKTVCLSMIVKNEAHVIRRCLASVRPAIDHWVVVDTGSTDGTQKIVRKAMRGLPGEVVERPWLNFGHNRSEALALARPHGDYSLVIDADDELDLPAAFTMPELNADAYFVDIADGGITYRRKQVMNNRLEWRYHGVLHEYPDCPEAGEAGYLPIRMVRNREGARSRDSATYAKDAEILERALATEADRFLISRYTFYLAQSYRDCGMREKAVEAYLRRAELGFWDQEIFVSLLQAGRLMEAMGRDPGEILGVYRRASDSCPFRAEAAHAAARLCRLLGRYAEGCAAAHLAMRLHAPGDGLFVEPWIYHYGLRDEFAVSAYWCGRYRDSLDATLAALETGKVPADAQPRMLANMRFALEKMS